MKKIDYTYSGILVKQNNELDSISILSPSTGIKKRPALSRKFYKMFANSVVERSGPYCWQYQYCDKLHKWNDVMWLWNEADFSIQS